jgi:ParB family chromosome partitioning protein
MIRLMQLPPTIQGLLERGELSAGHARALLSVEDRPFAEHIAARAAAEGWSVRQVEEAVRSRQGSRGGNTPRTRGVRQIRPAEVIELEHRLTDRLEAPIKVDYRAGKGSIRIDYTSIEDLERLYRRIMR